MPAAFCEAHHVVPWSRGGNTSLKDSKLLCSFHHHRAHDPAWETRHHPNGIHVLPPTNVIFALASAHPVSTPPPECFTPPRMPRPIGGQWFGQRLS